MHPPQTPYQAIWRWRAVLLALAVGLGLSLALFAHLRTQYRQQLIERSAQAAATVSVHLEQALNLRRTALEPLALQWRDRPALDSAAASALQRYPELGAVWLISAAGEVEWSMSRSGEALPAPAVGPNDAALGSGQWRLDNRDPARLELLWLQPLSAAKGPRGLLIASFTPEALVRAEEDSAVAALRVQDERGQRLYSRGRFPQLAPQSHQLDVDGLRLRILAWPVPELAGPAAWLALALGGLLSLLAAAGFSRRHAAPAVAPPAPARGVVQRPSVSRAEPQLEAQAQAQPADADPEQAPAPSPRGELFVERGDELLLLVDGNGRLQALSPGAQREFGLTSVAVKDQSIEDVLLGLGDQAAFIPLSAAIEAGRDCVIEVRNALTEQWYEFRLRAGKPPLEVHARNISVRKRAETDPEHRRAGEGLADQLSDAGSWELWVPERQARWSPQLMRLIGVDPAKLRGEPEQLLEFVHTDDLAAVRSLLRAMLGAAGERRHQFRVVRPDGAVRQMEQLIRAHANEQGRVALLLGSVRDVTESRMQSELELRQQQALNRIAQRLPLRDCARALVAMARGVVPDAGCALLVRSPDRLRMRVVADEGISDGLRATLDNMPIGGVSGSWGAVVAADRPSIVPDIQREASWGGQRVLAQRQNIAACWSFPVIGSRRSVIGTLALYFPVTRHADAAELRQLQRVTVLASIAINQMQLGLRMAGMDQRFRTLFDLSVDGIAALDQDGVVRMVNAGHERITGLADSLVLGRPIAEMPWPVDRRERMRDALMRALNRQTTQFEYSEQTAQGDLLRIEATLVPIVVETRVDGAFAVLRELERQSAADVAAAAETELPPSEARCVIDAGNDRVLHATPALARMLSLQGISLQGRSLLDFVRPDDRALLRDTLPELARSEGLEARVIRFIAADDRPCYLEWRVRLGRDGQFHASVRDVTQVHELTQQLATTRAQLALKRSELDQFTVLASRELQDPLRKIDAFCGRLLNRHPRDMNEQDRLFLERIGESAKQMQNVLDDLLTLAAIAEGSGHFDRVDLNAILANVLVDLEMQIHGRQARIEFDSLPVITGDPMLLTRAFSALLMHSLESAVAGRKHQVHVRASRNDAAEGGWIISLSDNGAGFADKDADQLFSPFHRHSGPRDGTASGMGLAIAKRVFEQHGGRATAVAVPGEGASYHIHIPDFVPVSSRQSFAEAS